MIAAIKTFHTLAWLSIESCVVYVLWAGFAARPDRRACAAAAITAGEMVVFPVIHAPVPMLMAYLHS